MQKETMPRLLEASLLETENSRHFLAEAAISAMNAAAVEPTRAVAQVADRITGSSHATDIAKAAKAFGIESRPAEFASANWFAQQFGAAAGMMAPYLLARGAVRLGVDKALGEAALSPAHIITRDLSTKALTRAAGAEATVTGTAGALYGLTFVPNSDKTAGSSDSAFVTERLKNAAFDGIAFGAIGAMSPFIGKGMDVLASKVNQFNTMAITGSVRAYERDLPLHDFLPKAQDKLVAAIRGPVLAGAISGVPIGVVNAEIGALKNGQLLPESKDIKENIVSMMFVGSAISKINHSVDAPNRRAAQNDYMKWLGELSSSFESYVRKQPDQKPPVIDANFARSISDAPDFRAWVFRNEKDLNSGEHKFVQNRMRELAKLWPELSTEARKVPAAGMDKILESWQYMTARQRDLPSADLLAHAKVIANFTFRKKAAEEIDSNPGFLKTYEGIQSRWDSNVKDSAKVASDGAAVLANWKDIPDHVKNSGDRGLMIIGSSWDKLTPTQKQLPTAELLRTATIIHDHYLKPAEAALLEHNKGFIDWYAKQTDFRSPDHLTPASVFNKFSTVNVPIFANSTVRSALKNWSELTPELKSVDLNTLRPIMQAWEKFTPNQKKLSVSELTELSKLQKSLNLDKAAMEKLESAPGFLAWFNSHKTEYLRPEYSIVDKDSLLPTWAELPPADRHGLTLRQAFDIAERWNSIKETHKEKSLKEILDTVSTANALSLNGRQTESLAQTPPSFQTWYKDHLKPQEPLPKRGPVLAELQAIAAQWGEWHTYPAEIQKMSVGSLRLLSNLWSHLPEQARTHSPWEIRNTAAVMKNLELSPANALTILQIEPLRRRVGEISKDFFVAPELDLSPVKAELKLTLDLWNRLPVEHRPKFENWLDNNLGDLVKDQQKVKELPRKMSEWHSI